jgi:hypothetical protein
MSTAIFIIALVGFSGRLVYSARAIRSWVAVSALVILAAALYGAPLALGYSVSGSAMELFGGLGSGAVVLFSLLMFGIGYGVPTFLAYAERRSRAWTALALVVSIVGTILAADLGRSVGFLPLIWLLNPAMCFVGGVLAYLIFRARIFEMESEPETARRERM